MGILSGNPADEPLHYGEVFGMWGYLMANQGCIVAYETFINHAGDDELRDLLKEALQEAKRQNEEITEVLKEHSVALPPTPPERTDANLEDIPVGARFNDPEISAALSMDTGKSLVACSQIMGQSIREDIGTLFGKFHMEKAQLGLKALRLNKKKGWLVPPPLHVDSNPTT